eukprot:31505-Pelagococcus_subviridis.AAC.2
MDCDVVSSANARASSTSSRAARYEPSPFWGRTEPEPSPSVTTLPFTALPSASSSSSSSSSPRGKSAPRPTPATTPTTTPASNATGAFHAAVVGSVDPSITLLSIRLVSECIRYDMIR